MPVLVVELVGERLPAILVGNSFGGRIALETAPRYGDRVPRLRPCRAAPFELDTASDGAPAWPEPRPLSALTMPVLVIVGERDTDDMPDASPARRPTREVIANASHHPSLEQPEAFNRLLLEFVA